MRLLRLRFLHGLTVKKGTTTLTSVTSPSRISEPTSDVVEPTGFSLYERAY